MRDQRDKLRDEAASWKAKFDDQIDQAEKDRVVARDEYAKLRAENARLESLFQETHGVHHSWVAAHERLRAENVRFRKACQLVLDADANEWIASNDEEAHRGWAIAVSAVHAAMAGPSEGDGGST